MEQAAQTFNQATFAISALLALIPLILFIAGYRLTRNNLLSFAGKALYWLAGHGVTLVIVVTLTLLRGATIPNQAILHLPLAFTLLYLLIGVIFRSPYFFSLGLAMPGLWMFVLKGAEAFTATKLDMFLLPQDPFWYALAALVIFGMQYLSKPRDFWEEAETYLATISGSYLMGAFWLLALGQASLLSSIGVPQYLWAAALVCLGAFLLWCAKYLRDPLFAGCSAIGLAAGVYAFISYYPWQSAAA